jgi:hypothetical protein
MIIFTLYIRRLILLFLLFFKDLPQNNAPTHIYLYRSDSIVSPHVVIAASNHTQQLIKNEKVYLVPPGDGLHR